MNIYIKNMVCNRCISSVKQQLEREGLEYSNLQLGQVELKEPATAEQLQALRESLRAEGFELLDEKKSMIVEKIKNTIITLIHHDKNELNLKLSALLEEKLQLDYQYLTTLFSSIAGITIERYTILQKVERVKELLMYGEMNISEIAFEMGYSSVQHLSQQFKKVTGLTPTAFRQLKENIRKPLDKI